VSDVAIRHQFPSGGRAHFSVGTDGSIYYVPDDASDVETELIWLDREGKTRPASKRLALYNTPSLSSSGNRVAYTDGMSVWVGDLARETWIEVAQGDFVQAPLWSPDDSTIAYEANTNGRYAIWRVPADGSKPPALLLEEQGSRVTPASWSPDGRWITFHKYQSKTDAGIWALDLRSGRSIQLAAAPAGIARISYDGHWVAYIGPNQIIQVQPFPETGPRSTILTSTPCPPAMLCGPFGWFRNSRELYFRDGKEMVSVVIRSSNGKADPGTPKTILEGQNLDPNVSIVDVSPDGKTFLAVRQKKKPRWDRINVVSGWWTP
jgi:dipeptidyl aminopeptidase/acylaminoacyl peptidase